ncbi:FIG041266: ATP-dependent nuclease subunit B [hydrothermal vent metagenome]|uniref:FIG041266: ATP-dependent nuclease subunit B n=1 Tax=hydrothermal vent metagenome TaxID=652676 RepID=A0A3B0S7P4_9ZZZZ
MNAETTVNKNVFYIPAGVPFLNSLARAILSGKLPVPGGPQPQHTDLARWTILLPTRRATRALMQAFMDEGKGTAQLLPRIQPLGDVDEGELALSTFFPGSAPGSLPDAISGLEQQFVLFELIHIWARQHADNPLAKMLDNSAAHAFDLARSLATLVESFEISNVDIKIIETLFDGEFAQHRQQILAFLDIVRKQLPEKMSVMGKIGISERRNLLMQAQTEFLASRKAPGPVIAAGSTGSIPATAQLLSCIASMENGAVVLPGLDRSLDEDSWNCLPEHHPQFGMRELLGKMSIARDDIAILPGALESPGGQAKNWLASELMRPADTTDQWREAVTKSRQTLLDATGDITVLDAEDLREQSLAIALIMRHGLEEKQTIALVTPDRQLARNVKTELSRWNIEIDDSAGEPLKYSPHATFLLLLLEAGSSRFSPLALKSLLFHPLSCFATDKEHRDDLFTKFEIGLLRSEFTYDGLQGLHQLSEKLTSFSVENPYAHPAFKHLTENDWQAILQLSEQLLGTLEPLSGFAEQNLRLPLSELITRHLQVAEAACHSEHNPNVLWQGDAGEKLSEIFSALQAAAHLAPTMTGQEYTMLIEQQLSQTVVRPRLVQQGRLAIYGLLEARLISTDVVILGGLNETVWPPIAEVDPWLTRPQLRNAGLTIPERKVGLSAHDFAQGFCARQVYLTYSKKLNNAPAVPSRWILRLNALLTAAGVKDACNNDPQYPWLEWARQLDRPQSFQPTRRPSPKPPIDLRPVNFSVSGIETLLKNPYAFFADKILKLKPLDPLTQQAGAADRGNIVHAGLHHFIQTYHDHLPEHASKLLLADFERIAREKISDATLRAFWQPQFVRMAEWFIDQEVLLRRNQKNSFLETSGQYSFKISDTSYLLTARADRLDLLDDQTVRIIDYKTGTLPNTKEGTKDFSPQLLLEAVICSQGGFKKIPRASVSSLVYIKLSGGVPAGSVVSAKGDIGLMAENADKGMKLLLSTYRVATQPYRANAEPAREDVEYDYDYLSRWREWAHLPDSEDA